MDACKTSYNIAKQTIINLSRSQGFYGRLKAQLDAENWEPLKTLCEQFTFESPLDFVLWIEG